MDTVDKSAPPTPADKINAAEARLRARLGDAERGDVTPTPRTWDPRHADDDPNPLLGSLVSISNVVTRYGPSLVAALRDDRDETWAVWITSATIKSEWEREDPQVGEYVMVHYGGLRSTKDGKREYPTFTVLVDRPDDAPAAGGARFGEPPS